MRRTILGALTCLILLVIPGVEVEAAEDHIGFCSWAELTKNNCSNVKYGGQWHCWCPKLTTPPPPS